MRKSWIRLARNTAMLSLESHAVIALRLARLARGGRAARREADLMISEKIKAMTEASARLALGASPNEIVRGYRKKVRANRRRLGG